MKVMCISKDAPCANHPDLSKAFNEIQVGGIYTVIDEEGNFYELEEFPHPKIILWEKRLFAPFSSIDETTFQRNYNTQTV